MYSKSDLRNGVLREKLHWNGKIAATTLLHRKGLLVEDIEGTPPVVGQLGSWALEALPPTNQAPSTEC